MLSEKQSGVKRFFLIRNMKKINKNKKKHESFSKIWHYERLSSGSYDDKIDLLVKIRTISLH